MADFSRQIALATKMIARYGAECLWQSRGPMNAGGSPAKPAGASNPTQVPCKIVFLTNKSGSLADLFSMMAVDVPDVPTTGARGLLAPTVGITPSVNDLILRGAETFALDLKNGVSVLAPDGTPVLYFLRFTK